MGFINAGCIGLLRYCWLCHPSWMATSFDLRVQSVFMDRWAISFGDGFASPSSKEQTESTLSFMESSALPSADGGAKFLSDAAWYFYLFWLPKYLYDARGFDVKQVSYFAWIPYAASGVGSFLGGWISSQLLRSGRSLDASRKWVLGINALMMTAVMLVTHVPVGYAIALFRIAFFAHSWSHT
jgi:hypothetical protein